MTEEVKEEIVEQPEEQPTETPEVDETPEETPETPAEENTDDAPKEEEKEEPEETPEEEESDEDEEVDSEYTEYEHPALKQAVNLLKEAEISVEDANAIFAEAVESGDITKIDKKALVEKLGQDKADVVLVLAESYYNTQFSKFKAIKDEAFSLTGGEENFNSMTEWAKEKAKADPEFAKDLSEFRAMLDSNQPRAIKAAISELFEIYKQDPDTTIEADLTVGDKAASTAGVEPLSRSEYINLVEKAHREGNYEQVRASLWARRSAGKKKGI